MLSAQKEEQIQAQELSCTKQKYQGARGDTAPREEVDSEASTCVLLLFKRGNTFSHIKLLLFRPTWKQTS